MGLVEKITKVMKTTLGSALTALVLASSFDSRGEEVAPEKMRDFIHHSGVNLPWGYNHSGGYSRYGWDIGVNPWGGANEGFSVKKAELDDDFAFMKNNKVDLCRVFLFCDFRTGLNYDSRGNIIGIGSNVNGDMQALVDTAKKYNIKLMPVLMDYLIADGTTTVPGSYGEHPEFITNSIKRTQLLENVLRPFIRKFGTNDIIYCWDIMNEPRWSVTRGIVSQSQMKSFLTNCVSLVKQESPNTLVSIGHDSNYFDLSDYGEEACTLTQVHDYNGWTYSTPASSVASNKSVIIGEIPCFNTSFVTTNALAKNYKGILFWSHSDSYGGHNFGSIAQDYTNFINSTSLAMNQIRFTSADKYESGIWATIYPIFPENRYSIDSRVNMDSGNWENFTNFHGSTGVSVKVNLPITGSNKFFRARTSFDL